MADSSLNCTRRGFVAASLAAGSMALLEACGKKGGDAAGSGASSDGAASGGTVNYYINNPACIDPYNCQEVQGAQVSYQLFDALTKFDFDKGKLVGAAADSWDASPDATQFTFHLHKGATFHNGDPVTSQDFKRAWTRLVSPKSAVATAYGPSEITYHLALVEGYDDLTNGKTDEFTGLTCPDDETFVVKLTSPYADFPYVAMHTALSPVPKAAEDDAKNYYLAPIGNGPFKMKGKWEDGQRIDVERYDDYWGDKPKIDGIHFAIQKDMETAYKEFQAGNLDVTEVPVASLDAAKSDRGESKDGYTMGEGGHLLLGTQLSTYFLACNTTAEPFNNADLRRGISLAINREAICKTLFKGARKPADDILPPGIEGYREGAWKYCAYDVDKAKEYLDKVAPAGADGSRGISVTLTYNQDGGHKEIMESVIGDLNKVGIKVTSDTPEWAAALDQYHQGKYQFGRYGWTADYPIADNFLFSLFHSSSIGGDNIAGYSNPEVDAAITEARTTVDDDERVKKMQHADDLMAEDSPVIPIMYYAHDFAGSDRVKELYIDPQINAHMRSMELSA